MQVTAAILLFIGLAVGRPNYGSPDYQPWTWGGYHRTAQQYHTQEVRRNAYPYQSTPSLYQPTMDTWRGYPHNAHHHNPYNPYPYEVPNMKPKFLGYEESNGYYAPKHLSNSHDIEFQQEKILRAAREKEYFNNRMTQTNPREILPLGYGQPQFNYGQIRAENPFIQEIMNPEFLGQVQREDALVSQVPADVDPFSQIQTDGVEFGQTHLEMDPLGQAHIGEGFGQNQINTDQFGQVQTDGVEFGQTQTSMDPFGQDHTDEAEFGQSQTSMDQFGQEQIDGAEFSQTQANIDPFKPERRDWNALSQTQTDSDSLGQVQTDGVEFGQVQTDGVEFGQVQTDGIEFGQIQTDADPFSQIQTDGVEFGQVQTNIDDIGQVETDGDEFGQSRVDTDTIGQVQEGVELSQVHLDGAELVQGQIEEKIGQVQTDEDLAGEDHIEIYELNNKSSNDQDKNKKNTREQKSITKEIHENPITDENSSEDLFQKQTDDPIMENIDEISNINDIKPEKESYKGNSWVKLNLFDETNKSKNKFKSYSEEKKTNLKKVNKWRKYKSEYGEDLMGQSSVNYNTNEENIKPVVEEEIKPQKAGFGLGLEEGRAGRYKLIEQFLNELETEIKMSHKNDGKNGIQQKPYHKRIAREPQTNFEDKFSSEEEDKSGFWDNLGKKIKNTYEKAKDKTKEIYDDVKDKIKGNDEDD